MSGKPAIASAAALLCAALAVALVSLRGEPKRQVRVEVSEDSGATVAPGDLALWIVEGRRDFTVVDLRSSKEWSAGHIRGAVHCGSCHADAAAGRKAQEGSDFIDLSKKLVLYAAAAGEPVELPRIIARNPNVLMVRGGWQGWQKEVLAPVVFGGEGSEDERLEKRRREALRAFFAGERASPAKPLGLPLTPIRRDNAHQAQGAHEGC